MPREFETLSEESLTRRPDEVFDILSKLGEGSYGSVFKALHKESGQVLAIKMVPVDTDLQDIIKEISIMQQCDSPYVVKYYGSYLENTDLWIVMEFCGAGSVLDIMKLRGIHFGLPKGEVKTLTEHEIATILSDTLKGLEYLHMRKKIHRDIKAGNILLNSEGHAKLADFGVAGQLTDTMAKRNTVIGTPFWMAPEVIQEIGYDCVADIWSLGITALEMAEGKAPYGEIHPMRAIFMIPQKPPPSFNKPDQWSPQFTDFVSRCLVKNPEERAIASQLLQHEFIKNPNPPESLATMIQEAQAVREKIAEPLHHSLDDSESTHTVREDGTLVGPQTTDDDIENLGTMIQHATLVPETTTSKTASELDSDRGTMIINESVDTEDDDTMKRYDTDDYRPAFLDHFENKGLGARKDYGEQQLPQQQQNLPPAQQQVSIATEDRQVVQGGNMQLQRQFEQIAGQSILNAGNSLTEEEKITKYHKSLLDGDLEFLKHLTYEELTSKISTIDTDMEREIDDLRRRYHAKRQPILDAIDQKRKRQQNF